MMEPDPPSDTSWVPTPVSWPRERGVNLEDHGRTAVSESRHDYVDKHLKWLYDNGTILSTSIKLVIDENGSSKFLASRFIPSATIVLQVPSSLDISMASLLKEISPQEKWIDCLRSSRDNYLRGKNVVSKFHIEAVASDIEFAVAIIGALHKIRTSTTRSFTLKLFEKYWQSLPFSFDNVLFSWSESDLDIMKCTSFYKNCYHNIKSLTVELFENVVHPFINEHPSLFGDDVDLTYFVKVIDAIKSRSFIGHKFHPIVDLMNGLPCQKHNCFTYSTVLGNSYVQVAQTSRDINANEEIFLSYAQKGNSDYLLSYDHIPLQRDVVLDNDNTAFYMNFGDFVESELQNACPSNSSIRTQVSTFIKNTVRIPDFMGLQLQAIRSDQRYIESIKLCLSVLLIDEKCWASQNAADIEASRTGKPEALIRLFIKFIERNVTVIPLSTLRQTLFSVSDGDPGSRHTLSAVLLYISEMVIVDTLCTHMTNLFPPGFLPSALWLMGHLMCTAELTALLDEYVAHIASSRPPAILCARCGSSDSSCMKCSRCKAVYYCNRECQSKHWAYHKKHCSAVCMPSK